MDTGVELFFEVTPNPTQATRPAVQFDGGPFATGQYAFTYTFSCHFPISRRSTTFTDRVIVHNETQSPFGAGWTLEGLHRLHHNDDGSLLLTMGNRSAWVYKPDLTGGFLTPSGDFATLTGHPDGSFTRTTEEGMRYDFDARGLLTTMADRNGNPTTYAYDTEGRLDRITDPVGLPTSLRYVAGRLQSITDPALRTTRLTHDAEGNLRSITDPDGATRSFTYAPGSHLLTTKTSARGFPTAYAYDFAGRLSASTLPDATPKSAKPRDVAGLIDTTEWRGDGGPPRPRRSWPISGAPRSMGGATAPAMRPTPSGAPPRNWTPRAGGPRPCAMPRATPRRPPARTAPSSPAASMRKAMC